MRGALWTLVGHSLRRGRGFLIAASLLLFGIQLVLILAARALQQKDGFSQLAGLMPEFMERLSSMLSFRGLVLFGYTHPIVLLCLVALAIAIGTEPAAEIESRFVDLLMARPLGRATVVNRTLVVIALATAGATGCMLAGTWLGLRALAPTAATAPEPRVMLQLAANLALVVVAWGAIALAVATFSRRRAAAAAICGLLAFATFVLDYLGRLWDGMAGLARLSPFHYFSPFAMIGGETLPLTDVAVLLAISVVGALVAHGAYARRDL